MAFSGNAIWGLFLIMHITLFKCDKTANLCNNDNNNNDNNNGDLCCVQTVKVYDSTRH